MIAIISKIRRLVRRTMWINSSASGTMYSVFGPRIEKVNDGIPATWKIRIYPIAGDPTATLDIFLAEDEAEADSKMTVIWEHLVRTENTMNL